MRIQRVIAVWAAKIVSLACRISGTQGVTLAGKIAMQVDRSILSDLSSQVREKIFVVCGTNGKTTTNNLLCSAIESEGKKVVCNHTGSNMIDGVAAAFVLSAKLTGRLDADYACIEVDEASAARVFPYICPDYMVLTNLFRDQLDRYGEIDATMIMLSHSITMVPDLEIIVNADDALSTYLVMESGHTYVSYGISERVFPEQKQGEQHEIREGRFCQKCGAKLEYEFYHYSQIGKYRCPNCGFERPKPDYDASNIDMEEGLSFDVEGRHIHADYRGFYNIYNILAAYAAGRTAKMKLSGFEQVLSSFNPQNGRMENFKIHGTEVVLNLAKNPAGFNQNISAVMEDEREKDILIVINDNAQDGTDISWLWDVDFDLFAHERICSIMVSGIRCQDMRLRLKYVDIPCEMDTDVKSAVSRMLEESCGNLYVLVNYTALFSTRAILSSMAGGKK